MGLNKDPICAACKKEQEAKHQQEVLDRENRVAALKAKLMTNGYPNPVAAEKRAREIITSQTFQTGFGKLLNGSFK